MSMVMKILALAGLLLGLALGGGSQPARAGSFDFGLGLGFADSTDSNAFEGGWDVIAGYERDVSDGWHWGAQMHVIKGWTDKDSIVDDTGMFFRSTALYATARPEDWWLQFSGGVVSADYNSLTMDGGGTGIAMGLCIVLGDDDFRFHLLDIHRYIIGGQGFNVYSISFLILFEPFGQKF